MALSDAAAAGVGIAFSIRGWAAYAPGLETPDAWRAWAGAPHVPQGDGAPALLELPPMTRRRIDPLGRIALQTAYWARGDASSLPTVFASRRGDSRRSFELLETLARGEGLSPTSFGLSVHNAIAAQYSIANADHASYTAVAAGRSCAEAALIEAATLLADADEVLVVVYEAPVPAAYARYADEPDATYGWAWRIGRPRADLETLTLRPLPAASGSPQDCALPHALDVLRFMLDGSPALTFVDGTTCWQWRRDA